MNQPQDAPHGGFLVWLRDAWLVLVIGTGSGALLMATQAGLSPAIERNKLQVTLGQIPRLVPGATSGQVDTVAGRKVFKALAADRTVAGWVIPAKGQGFADVIELLVGIDATGTTITGMAVVDQKETPALGDKIRDMPFRSQFCDTQRPLSPLRPVTVTTGAPTQANQVRAIAGATISSRSVCDIINQALGDPAFRAALAAAAGGGR